MARGARALAALTAACMLVAASSVTVSPDLPPAQRSWNATGNSLNQTELPFDYVAEGPGGITLTTVKTVPGCAPEQVSLSFFGTDDAGGVSVLVSWATCDTVMQTSNASSNCTGPARSGAVDRPLSTAGLLSRVYWGPDRGSATQPSRLAEGNATSYVYDYMAYTGIKYRSPVLHHVLITGLARGRRYAYAVVDSVASASPDGSTNRPLRPGELGPNPFRGSFKAPGQAAAEGSQFPLHVAVIGDPGQTYNTSRTLTQVMRGWGLDAGARRPWNRGGLDLLMIVGDLSYANDIQYPGTAPSGCTVANGATYQPRWDTWARLVQPLLSAIPGNWMPGNHELEFLAGNAYFNNYTSIQKAYNLRFPMPQRGPREQPATVPILGRDTGYGNGFWATKVPGVATFISLTSYSPNDVDFSKPDMNGFSKTSEQYMWLERELKAVDRSRTPWLILSWHAPWYSTYVSHFKENECMRQLYEPLLLQHSVDIVFNGHVHAYERSKPMADYKVDRSGCAPMHIVVGDAGNIEGASTAFIAANSSSTSFNCSAPLQRVWAGSWQPQACYAFNSGPGSGCAPGTEPCYCPNAQPAWSAYREPSFGHGRLYLQSTTKAVWQWVRNQDSHVRIADEVEITRLPRCGV